MDARRSDKRNIIKKNMNRKQLKNNARAKIDAKQMVILNMIDRLTDSLPGASEEDRELIEKQIAFQQKDFDTWEYIREKLNQRGCGCR